MSGLLFSVIIPTHHRPQLLRRLLDSLQDQSLSKDEFEVIVVATLNDPAYELIESAQWALNLRVLSIPNDPSKGRSASAKRNYGAQLARAPWLAFTDDDCVAHSNWLKNAAVIVANKKIAGIEGYTHIPEPERKSLTYKGILRLSRPGGYQTCNMFYRKEDFLAVGGFDQKFPFYLEDTDLAWTLLERDKVITYSSEVCVEHPVPPPEPKRLLDYALRMRLLPYLAAKHPGAFARSSMRAYPRPYIPLLLLDCMMLASLMAWSFSALVFFAALRLLATTAYLLRLFYGVHFTWREWFEVFFYTLICPLIGFVQLVRGNWQQKTTLFFR